MHLANRGRFAAGIARNEGVTPSTLWRDYLGYAGIESNDYIDNMHARHYDPNLGRFLSVDPVVDVKRALRSPQMWNRYSYVVNNPMNRIDPDGRLVQLVGTDDERRKALALIKANLREQDRKYVTMSKNGVLSVDSKAKGGLGLSMLRDLARKDQPTVNVRLGLTYTDKSSTSDLALSGGGTTVPTRSSISGNIEVNVNPNGGMWTDLNDSNFTKHFAPAKVLMGHELFGHAFDLMVRGKSSERSAITTETNLLWQLGEPALRPVPKYDWEW
jgi:RHS repeat-associated protein